jgi:tetratricopeptide (TPR) repeat protein
MSDAARILLMMEKNAEKTLELADRALKTDSSNKDLRFLRALALLNLEKEDDAKKVLAELGSEDPIYTPALYKLAEMLALSEDKTDIQRGIELYGKYSQIEPRDPRPYHHLAMLYEQPAEKEAALRKVVELNPESQDGYSSLIAFLVEQGRLNETTPLFLAWEKDKKDSASLLTDTLGLLLFSDTDQVANFAKLYPQHFKENFASHMLLARFHYKKSNHPEALRLLTVAKQIEKKSTEPYNLSSEILRGLSRWITALREADKAVSLDPKDAEAHYERACSLAQLRRPKDALAALTKAIELDDSFAEFLEEEEDLKPLATLPGFKKLLPKE